MKQNDIVPEMIMLVGLPGSGKSTWIRNHMTKNPDKNYVIVSSDDIIEELGAEEGLNYNEAFKKYSKKAMGMMKNKARTAFSNYDNIIWDQTNMTVKSRKDKLRQALERGYDVKSVVFSLTDTEWKRRYNRRKSDTGKHIPDHVIDNMSRSYEAPTKEEGFSDITYIKN